MLEAFASDFDGTLFFWGSKEPIRCTDVSAIEALRNSGVLFGLCTGRTLNALLNDVGTSIDFDFFITMTGAAIFDGNCEPIFVRTLPRDLVITLHDEFAKHADPTQADLICAADDYWCLRGGDEWKTIKRVTCFDEIPDPFSGFAFGTTTSAEATEIAARINQCYGDVVTAFQNLNSIDVVPAACSKGSGIRKVCEHFGIDRMAGIGDSFNDIAMLEASDIAYSFNASAPAIREVADVLVDSVAEAIADFIARPSTEE